MQTRPLRHSFMPFLLAVGLFCLGTACTPSGPKALLQGAELLRKGKYDQAIARLQIAKDLLPNDARAWNYLGLAYHGAGQHGEAIIAYQRAQQLDPNLAEARYNLGELFLEQGNPVSAADEYTVFTALQPKSVEGWLRLGDAQLQNQRLDRAQTSYHLALNLKRETPAAFNGLGLILLQRKNPRDAYRYFVEAVKYDPHYTPAILNMAVVAQTQLGSLPTALGKYREYLAKAPNAPNAAEVQSVIRQIETTLNPRPAAPVVAAVNLPSASNTLARVVTPTNAPPKPTNLVTAASSNTARIASARTNLPATATGPDLETSAKATNQPPVRLAGTEAARTNPATVNPPVTQTEPKTTKVAAANPAHTPTTATSPVTRPADPEPPLEEVKVADTEVTAGPEILPAGEIQKPAMAAASPGSSSPSSEAPQSEERKRGFFKRINPVNLFRSEKPEQPPKRPTGTVTPLPPENSASANAAAPATSTPPSTTVARNERPDVTPMPGSTSAARYEYGRVKRPVAGDRGSAERLFERGIGAQSRQDPAGATTFFEAAVKADGTYFAAHYNLGLISYAGGQWFKALSAFETALVLDPNSAEARYNFALALQKARFPQDAARELERVLAQNPRDARAALLLGKVQAEDLKDVAAARRQYQRVLELEPQHPQAAAIRFWLSEHP